MARLESEPPVFGMADLSEIRPSAGSDIKLVWEKWRLSCTHRKPDRPPRYLAERSSRLQKQAHEPQGCRRRETSAACSRRRLRRRNVRMHRSVVAAANGGPNASQELVKSSIVSGMSGTVFLASFRNEPHCASALYMQSKASDSAQINGFTASTDCVSMYALINAFIGPHISGHLTKHAFAPTSALITMEIMSWPGHTPAGSAATAPAIAIVVTARSTMTHTAKGDPGIDKRGGAGGSS
eukprot:CAMPEP_0176182870 /NCGR_PEP_ID=MMETSP0120_2-20121206/93695_1 /TAXON_ID=160619 /ORGANISM="Kryptoperidinium foliaceum, Strain CCMP 1326" /LENGTH=238 /DNA_ID=CAMNT_0017521123 /DNA_START=103 /DNA_END=821 /DNA_ORIENTATION=+